MLENRQSELYENGLGLTPASLSDAFDIKETQPKHEMSKHYSIDQN